LSTVTESPPDLPVRVVVRHVQRLSQTIRTAEARQETLRPERDAAMLSARLDHGARPIECYKPGHINRNRFARMTKQAVEEESYGDDEIRMQPRHAYPTKDAALQAVRASAAGIARAKASAAAARKERDLLILPMLHGEVRHEDGTPFTDVEVREMTGLTSARIAQIKSGER
jgi:hypothetical protein